MEENAEDDIEEDLAEDNAEKNENRVIGSNAEMVELERFVYDEDEKIQDKLISVYQAAASYENAKLFMLIRSDDKEQKIYLGVANEDSIEATLLAKQLEVLGKNIIGNFPGTKLKKFKNIQAEASNKKGKSAFSQKQDLLREVFAGRKNVAAISGIPSIKL